MLKNLTGQSGHGPPASHAVQGSSLLFGALMRTDRDPFSGGTGCPLPTLGFLRGEEGLAFEKYGELWKLEDCNQS